MTDKIKFYLEDRLKRLESIRDEREWTTAELGDITCCKQTLEFIDSLQEEPNCDERQFDELSKLQKGIGQIAKAVYEHKGKENPTVEKIREILIENSFDRMEIRGEMSKKVEPVSKDFEMALAEMIDKAQKNVIEPWVVAAQWKDELIELVKSEEPVNEKKCMFTKDVYTDEDRKVLCEDCKERCEYSKKEEPVSEDLKKAAVEAFKKIVDSDKNSFLEIFKAGAEWQKEKDMASLPAKAL